MLAIVVLIFLYSDLSDQIAISVGFILDMDRHNHIRPRSEYQSPLPFNDCSFFRL